MNAEYFIDTNVFVYQIERLDARKFAVAGSIIERAIASGDGCVSFQVVQETLNVASRKSQRHAPEDDLRFYLDTVLAPLLRVPATVDLYHRALDIQSRHRYAFYDALIVAAALQAGCRRLYSEDLQHGQRIEGLTIENPFIEA